MSPVIGVILMVAITVILAAVIGSYAFGLGSPEEAPQASLKGENFNNKNFTLVHQGGEPIPYDGIKITVNGTDISSKFNSSAGDGNSFSVGETYVIEAGDKLYNNDKIKFIHNSSQQIITEITVTK